MDIKSSCTKAKEQLEDLTVLSIYCVRKCMFCKELSFFKQNQIKCLSMGPFCREQFFSSLKENGNDVKVHGLRTPSEEIAFTARPKIHSQIFTYGRGMFLFSLSHRPKFSDFFDLCHHWVSVVRVKVHQIIVNI